MSPANTSTFVLAALLAGFSFLSRQHAASAGTAGDAPSFSCMRTTASAGTAEAAIERAICADPKLAMLDRTLDRSFREAMAADPTGKAELLASQRAWLKSRVAACQADGSDTATAMLATCLAGLYDARIAALAASSAPGTMACRALASRIRETEGYLAGPRFLGAALRGDERSPIVFGKGQPLTQALLDRLPSKPRLDLKNEDATLYPFGADRSLFAIDFIQGTARCEYLWLYRIVKGGAFEPIADPDQKSEGNGCGATTLFGSYADPALLGAPVALYVDVDDTLARSSLTLQARNDDAWHPACTLEVVYDTKLAIDERYCAPGAPCAALATLALDLARRRDASGNNAPLRLGDALRVTGGEEKTAVDLPTFGKDGSAYDTFEADAPIYKIDGPTGPLVLRISHGTVGWRIGEDWIVGVYKPSGSLEPLAGFAIKKSRTRLREVTVR